MSRHENQKSQRAWNAPRYTRRGNRYDFAFAGEMVVAVRFGGDVRIYLGDDFRTCIELWTPFTLTQFGQSHLRRPRETTSLASLLALIGGKVVQASADSQGLLEMAFENGMAIKTPPDPAETEWEAWQITDEYGFQVVCAIGGSLAIWAPGAESSRRIARQDEV